MKAEIAIIGAGPAGLSAAIYTARAGKKTIVLKGKSKSHLELGHMIENYPGFESVPGTLLLEKIEKQAKNFGTSFIMGDALALNLESNPKMISTRNEVIEADTVLLAMGRGVSKKRIINEEKFLGRGLSYCAVCDGAFYRGKKVAVYGPDDEAADDALMLAGLGCAVTLLYSSKEIKGTAGSIQGSGINVINGAEIIEATGDDVLSEIIIKTGNGEYPIRVSALFIIADIPSGTLLKETGIEFNEKDCVSVNRNMETNIPGVYAAGDITCGSLQAVVAAGEGATAALSALKYMRRLGQAA